MQRSSLRNGQLRIKIILLIANSASMKKKSLILLLLITSISRAQEFKDRIYLKTGDSVICKITEFKGSWIYYDLMKKDKIKQSKDHMMDVVAYRYNGVLKSPKDYTPKSYSEVVQVDSNITKNELFSTYMDWIAQNYKSAQNVVQYQDKEAGKIVAKGLFKVMLNDPFGAPCDGGSVYHTLSIYIKDGRFRYILDDIHYDGSPKFTASGDLGDTKVTGFLFKGQWDSVKLQSEKECKKTIQSLKAAASNAKKAQDW